MLTVSRYVVFSPDLAERSPATFGPNIIFEMWERMTYGGVQLDFNSRLLLEWINDVRFEPYGHNYWRVHVAR